MTLLALRKLPSEIIEHILVFAALDSSPSSIACLAATCKYLNALIYHTPDQHLWRSVFLAVFDDPRPLLQVLHSPGPHGVLAGLDKELADLELEEEMNILRSKARRSVQIVLNWEAEYKSRIQAAQYLATDDHGSTMLEETTDLPILAPTCSALLSMLTQSLPCAPVFRLPGLSFAPPFPPLILQRWYKGSVPPIYASRNSEWVEKQLRRGYPEVLVSRIFGGPILPKPLPPRRLRKELQDLPHEAVLKEMEDLRITLQYTWQETTEGQHFHKLVFLTGLRLPNSSQSLAPAGTPSSSSDISASLSSQLQSARANAGRKVYDMSYLSQDREWGPFLRKEGIVPDEAGFRERGLPRREDADEEDADDEDYLPPSDQAPADTSPPRDLHPHELIPDYSMLAAARLTVECSLNELLGRNNEEDSDTESASEDAHDAEELLAQLAPWPSAPTQHNAQSSTPASSHTHQSSSTGPSTADSAAAADAGGTAAEANDTTRFRRIMQDLNGNALHCLEFLRMGGAPDYWRLFTTAVTDDSESQEENAATSTSPDTTSAKGKAHATDDGTIHLMKEPMAGWDWAGVEGIWQRSVCWMDYRDLLHHNLSFRQGVPVLEPPDQIIRIFPMKLRITGYLPPPPPPPSVNTPVYTTSMPLMSGIAYKSSEEYVLGSAAADVYQSLVYRLPILLVEGESLGSDMDPDEQRRIRGRVSMIGDGAVRWSLVGFNFSITFFVRRC
ncbi:hypothetical protein HGRIS_010542 [Hohenbuehelia grisea]|uniref:F-box domain-containing protein n=1 Tax=Hohenbuehelia grisea TaxID=104357 RepID=A0ABR3IX50_9AGAR